MKGFVKNHALMRTSCVMIAVFVIISLFAVPVMGAYAAETTPPTASVVLSTILNADGTANNDYCEVSLKISAGSDYFAAAGAVIQYNMNYITPALVRNPSSAVPMAETSSWRAAAAPGNISPAEMEGRSNFTYKAPADDVNAAWGENTGYMELYAEAQNWMEPGAISGTKQYVATAVFRYVGETEEARATVKSYITGEDVVLNAEPSATADPSNPDATEVPHDVIKGDGVNQFLAGNVIRIAPDAVSSHYANPTGITSFVNYGMTVHTVPVVSTHAVTGEKTFGDLIQYISLNDMVIVEGALDKKTMIGVPLSGYSYLGYEKDQASKNEGSGGGGEAAKPNYISVVMFDWDETTMLGSTVLDAAATADEIQATLDQFTVGFMHPDFQAKFSDNTKWTANTDANVDNDTTSWGGQAAVLAEDGSVTTAAVEAAARYETFYNADGLYPLTNKDGYTFGKWVEFNSDAYTVYGRMPLADNANAIIDEPSPAEPDYGNVSGGLVLKAAFIANTSMDDLVNAGLRKYVISNSIDVNDGFFNRFGVSTSYSITVEIKRVNASGRAVHRPRKSALKVYYTTSDGATIYTLQEIANVDYQTVSFAAPNNAVDARVTLMDSSVENWVNAGDRATELAFNASPSEAITPENADSIDLGYVVRGSLGQINEYGMTNQTIDGNMLTPCQFDLSSVTGTAAAKRRKAAEYLTNAFNSMGDVGTRYPLTWAQMQYVINNAGALPPIS